MAGRKEQEDRRRKQVKLLLDRKRPEHAERAVQGVLRGDKGKKVIRQEDDVIAKTEIRTGPRQIAANRIQEQNQRIVNWKNPGGSLEPKLAGFPQPRRFTALDHPPLRAEFGDQQKAAQREEGPNTNLRKMELNPAFVPKKHEYDAQSANTVEAEDPLCR